MVTKKAKSILGTNKDNSEANAEDRKDAAVHASNVKQMESNASKKNKEEAVRKDNQDSGNGSGNALPTGSSATGLPNAGSNGQTNYVGRHEGNDLSDNTEVEINERDNRSSCF